VEMCFPDKWTWNMIGRYSSIRKRDNNFFLSLCINLGTIMGFLGKLNRTLKT